MDLKLLLKRGALLAAANWPTVAIQFIAETTLQVLLAVPIVGAAILVAVLLGGDLADLLQGSLRDIFTTIASTLLSEPLALVAFMTAFAIVLLGGSVLMFLVKGGTMEVLLAANEAAGPIEREPLTLETFRRASRFTLARFTAGCSRLFHRYLALGLLLMLVYALSIGVYLAFVVYGYRAAGDRALVIGWTFIAALAAAMLVVWITIVNLLYLLLQIAMAVDGVGVSDACRATARFVRAEFRELAGVFLVVVALVVAATLASALAWSGVGLIAFVPLVGLAVFPLQLAALLLRGLVFEYLGLTALGAYLTLYRGHAGRAPKRSNARAWPRHPWGIPHDRLRRLFLARRPHDAGVGDSQDGRARRARARPHLLRARFPAPELFAWDEFRDVAQSVLSGSDPSVLQYGPTRGYRPLVEALAQILGERGITATPEEMMVTTGSQQALDLTARVFIDPGSSCSSSCRPTRAASPRSTTRRRRSSASARIRTASISRIWTASPRASAAGRRIAFLYVVPNFQNPTGLLVSLEKRQRLLEWAARRDVLIVEDDPYGALHFDDVAKASDTRPIKADDREGRVVYLSSFSKTVAPGFRVAWIAAPAPIAAKFEVAKQAADLCTGALDQRIVYEVWKRGVLAARLPGLRSHYQANRTVMAKALRHELGDLVSWPGAEGRILSVGGVSRAGEHRRAADAGGRARRRVRCRQRVLRRRPQLQSRAAVRSPRRRRRASKKASGGWPPPYTILELAAASSD